MSRGEPVHRGDWDRWRWRIVAAFVALCVANALGFVMLESETASRQAVEATANRVTENSAAIGRLAVETCRRANVVRAYLRAVEAAPGAKKRSSKLFPIVNCDPGNFAKPLPERQQQAYIRRALNAG